jgi:hypothetical protein
MFRKNASLFVLVFFWISVSSATGFQNKPFSGPGVELAQAQQGNEPVLQTPDPRCLLRVDDVIEE